MHPYIINASIQILPIVHDKSPYAWVDDVIGLIRKSGVKYEVGPFSTVLEGNYADIMKVIDDINEFLYSKGCEEWIQNIQIQIRSAKDVTAEEKVAKFRK